VPLRRWAPLVPGILSTGAAQKSPFINPSTLWTILVCPRSYPHAKSLDAIDDRDGDIHWPGTGLGWRRHLGLGHRLTTLASHAAVSSPPFPGRCTSGHRNSGSDRASDRKHGTGIGLPASQRGCGDHHRLALYRFPTQLLRLTRLLADVRISWRHRPRS
jgi:hypothetical protein